MLDPVMVASREGEGILRLCAGRVDPRSLVARASSCLRGAKEGTACRTERRDAGDAEPILQEATRLSACASSRRFRKTA